MACNTNQDLHNVNKPVRYIGQEWNQIKKKLSDVKVRIALAFPDVYEIGMSHLGLKILYSLINRNTDFYAERVFTPWVDRENQLRSQAQKLYSLETHSPLGDFDLIGFSLQYELSYTNLLTILDLAGLPFAREDRNGLPIIIAGGPNTFNPEPLANIIDCFFIGDAEKSIIECLEIVKDGKEKDWHKEELLANLARIDGVYVPKYYDIKKDGLFYCVSPKETGLPSKIQKRVELSLNEDNFPTEFIIPYTKITHDRVTLEISRGCTRGCRFCQAGMIYRPKRERDTKSLENLAESLLKTSGYDEISLLSLSATDHSKIAELISTFTEKYNELGIGVALPSLRADAFSVNLAQQIQTVRKTGLTFAPEAGSQRLRDVINKGVTEEDLLKAGKAAFEAGWSSLKLYFMLGLPTETDEDIMAIIQLANKIRAMGLQYAPQKPQITVSVSTFIPKPHTPFQWEPLLCKEEVLRRQNILRNDLRGRAFKLQWNDWDTSLLEALFSRGDRRLGNILIKAWQKGCRFDSWGEHFKPALWWEAIEEEKLPWEEMVCQRIDFAACLPWEHIDTGISPQFLKKEMEKADKGILTENCLNGKCHGCGCCKNLKSKKDALGGN